MNYLVTGGAGYIGSHMVRMLQKNNHEVTVIDNLSTGHKDLVSHCEFIEMDIQNLDLLYKSLLNRKFDGVFHFAARSIVKDSFVNPDLYKKNNINGTKNMILLMKKNEIENLIFSSSAAVYGNNHNKMIKETDRKIPESPYGLNKLESENLIESSFKGTDFKSISFRYFNAAGADPSGEIGENHDPETHLIPNLINSILNLHSKFNIYGGTKNPPADGTCVRDYVHVNDIVNAHYLGMRKINELKSNSVFNIGSGRGYSVMQVLKAVEIIANKNIKYSFSDERNNEPSFLVADIFLIKEKLKWSTKYNSIEEIVKTAWNWHNK